MQYKKLGRTGLYVSRLCLGTMNFGDCTDKKSAFEIMDRAAELGINFIDTADVYGGPQRPDIPLGYGISEEIVGEWLAQSGKRNEVVLATKLYQPMIPGSERPPLVGLPYSPGLRRQFAASEDRPYRSFSVPSH